MKPILLLTLLTGCASFDCEPHDQRVQREYRRNTAPFFAVVTPNFTPNSKTHIENPNEMASNPYRPEVGDGQTNNPAKPQ